MSVGVVGCAGFVSGFLFSSFLSVSSGVGAGAKPPPPPVEPPGVGEDGT